MVRIEDHVKKIRETEQQIKQTTSKQRKYELNRHLRKLKKEYSFALINMRG